MKDFDIKQYWDERYKNDRDSGSGSYGRLAKFKAEILNKFVLEHNVRTVLELGCGDGNQLSMFKFESYTGVDISDEAIKKCIEIYKDDTNKTFQTYEQLHKREKKFDMCISLDVIYHLTNDNIYKEYMQDLFNFSKKYVVIFSNDTVFYHKGVRDDAGYLGFRNFSEYVKHNFKDWSLIKIIPNEYPFSPLFPEQTSFADFYFYERTKNCKDITEIYNSYFLKKNLNYQYIFNEALYMISESNKILNKEVNLINNKLDTTIKELGENRNTLLDRKKEIEEVRRSLDEKEEKLKRITENLINKEEELEEVNRKFADEIIRLENKNEELIKAKNYINSLKKEIQIQIETQRIESLEYKKTIQNLIESNDKIKRELEILCNSKLGKLTKKYWNLKAKVEKKFFKNVLDNIDTILELSKQTLNGEKLLSPELWYSSTTNVIFKKNNNLSIECNTDKSVYISFIERNNSYDILPKTKIIGLRETEYKIEIKGEVEGNSQVVFYLIEYSNSHKTKVHILELNKVHFIKMPKDNIHIRIAARISGNGTVKINKFLIDMVNEDDAELKLSVKKEYKSIDKISDLKIACIFDEFTMTCYEKECQLITFTPEDWKETLTKNTPDMLFVESAWRGNFGTWEHKIAKYNNQDKRALISLIDWCKEQDIPTVFWNKEDPVHFDKFIDTAILFDYIFTTDENMVEKYKERTNKNNVFSLPFSAQPKLHNPIKLSNKRIDKLCFAGSYYSNRHEDRRRDMDNILDIAQEYGLDIYDRNFERNQGGDTHFSFPEKFRKNIVGSLKYEEINKAYKGYKVLLNVNSIKDSPTMFSRRVFEGLACGTPILSTYAEGIKNLFNGIVLTSEDTNEIKENLGKLMNDELYYRKKSLMGIREVYANHLYKHRIQYLLSKIGILVNENASEFEKGVTIISSVKNKEEFEKLLSIFYKQDYSYKYLTVFLEKFDGWIDIINKYNTKNIHIFVKSFWLSNDGNIEELIKSKYIAFFNHNNFYGEYYLSDLMLAFQYSDANIVGKSSYYMIDNNSCLVEMETDKEYIYVDDILIQSSIIAIDLIKDKKVQDIILMSEDNINAISSYLDNKYKIFSSDKYNYIKNYDGELLKEYEDRIEI